MLLFAGCAPNVQVEGTVCVHRQLKAAAFDNERPWREEVTNTAITVKPFGRVTITPGPCFPDTTGAP